MSEGSGAGADDEGRLARVAAALRDRSGELFPELDRGRVRTRQVWHRPRPRCSLAHLEVTDGDRVRAVVVKLRRDAHSPRAGDAEGRPHPVDAPDLPAAEAAALEHEGLGVLAGAVAAYGDPRLRAVRPLLLLPDDAALVMEHLALPTLRDRLVAGSRLRGPRAAVDPEPWRAAGALLALQHRAQPAEGKPARLVARADLDRLVRRLTRYLGSRGQPADLLRRVDARADELLARVPDVLATAVGHGDFTPRNLFVDPCGGVVLFDPMPRWSVPRADDLATFLVAVRLSGPQLATRGAAFSRRQLARLEHALLAGYGVPADAPDVALLTLVHLMDRWCWLASSPIVPSRRGRVRQAWLRQEVHREARRLLAAPVALLGLACALIVPTVGP